MIWVSWAHECMAMQLSATIKFWTTCPYYRKTVVLTVKQLLDEVTFV